MVIAGADELRVDGDVAGAARVDRASDRVVIVVHQYNAGVHEQVGVAVTPKNVVAGVDRSGEVVRNDTTGAAASRTGCRVVGDSVVGQINVAAAIVEDRAGNTVAAEI